MPTSAVRPPWFLARWIMLRRLARRSPIIFGLVVANLLVASFWGIRWAYGLLTRPSALQERTRFYKQAYVKAKVFSDAEAVRFAQVRDHRDTPWKDEEIAFYEGALARPAPSGDAEIQTLREFLLVRSLTARRETSSQQRSRIVACLLPLFRPETDRHRVENVDWILRYLRRTNDAASQAAIGSFDRSGGLKAHEESVVRTKAHVGTQKS